MTEKFVALVVEESAPGKFTRQIKSRSVDELPQGELLVRVHYSSLKPNPPEGGMRGGAQFSHVIT